MHQQDAQVKEQLVAADTPLRLRWWPFELPPNKCRAGIMSKVGRQS